MESKKFLKIDPEPKGHTDVNFPKYLWGCCARESSCAPIMRFFSAASDGATAERQILNRMFLSIL